MLTFNHLPKVLPALHLSAKWVCFINGCVFHVFSASLRTFSEPSHFCHQLLCTTDMKYTFKEQKSVYPKQMMHLALVEAVSCLFSTASHAAFYIVNVITDGLSTQSNERSFKMLPAPEFSAIKIHVDRKSFDHFQPSWQTGHIYHKSVFLLIQQILTEHQQCARIC